MQMRIITLFFIAVASIQIFAQDLIIVEFSEPMDTTNLFNHNNYIISSLGPYANMHPDPEIKGIFKPSELPLDSLFYVYIVTEEHLAGEYQLQIFNVYDLAGNMVNIEHNFALYNCSAGDKIKSAGRNKGK